MRPAPSTADRRRTAVPELRRASHPLFIDGDTLSGMAGAVRGAYQNRPKAADPDDPEDLVRFEVLVPARVRSKARGIAKARGISIAELVRELLEAADLEACVAEAAANQLPMSA